jgi:hypothetical protein
MKGGGHLAILRSGFGATKESEMAAGDIEVFSTRVNPAFLM